MEPVGLLDLGGDGLELAARDVDGRAAALADDGDGWRAGPLVCGGPMAKVRVFDDAGLFEGIDGAIERGGIEIGEQRQQLLDGDPGIVVEEVLDEVSSRVGDPAAVGS